MSSSSEMGPLPPGWDTKFDPRTGRYYFINHYTKSTSWEDPRVRYQQIGKSTSSSTVAAPTPTKPEVSSSSSIATTAATATGGTVKSGGSKRGDASTVGSEHPPLQKYPIGTIPAPAAHDTEGATATLTQQQVIQELSSRHKQTPSSPLATHHSGAHYVHLGSSSGGAGTGVQASPLPLQRLQLEESYSPRVTSGSHRRESQQLHVLADIAENASDCVSAEQALQNVSAMFPTVDEGHIKDLLKKYHGSQAVVISALQVAKHPFITPGPSTVYTPPPTRHSTLPGATQGVLSNMAITGSLPHYYNQQQQQSSSSAAAAAAANMTPSVSSSGYPTPRPGSAASGFDNSFSMGSPQIGGGQGSNLFRSFPRPHSSPKMKLRYLKSVFPTVEEYLLLDVLSNSDNNVQKAADRLVKMGYVKRDTPSAPRLHARRKEEERLAEKRTPLPKPPPIKTDKEKDELRRKMKDKYEVKFDIPERILYMALESVLYDEEQANSLIISMIEDDLKRKKSKEAEKAKEKEKKSARKSPKPTRKALEAGERQPKHTSPKHEPKKASHGKKEWSSKTNVAKEEIPTITRGTSTQEDTSYRSSISAAKAKGPNPTLRKGPNDDLLLTDYVTWNGPDPELRKGSNKSMAKGANPELRRGSRGVSGSGGSNAKGPNAALRKGPAVGLAKGSIYAQLGGDGEEQSQEARGR